MKVTGTPAFTRDGSILATIDKVAMLLPDDPENSERRMLADWEKAGGVIASFVEPPPTDAELRAQTFQQDAERASLMDRLHTATPDQLDGYVDNQINGTTIAALREQVRREIKRIYRVIALDAPR